VLNLPVQRRQAPDVDRLSVTVLVDLTHNIFLRPTTFKGMAVAPAPRAKDYTKELHTQWGLSYFLQSTEGSETRSLMLDYAYTPEALLNNIDIIGVQPNKLDALMVSHGHFDHYGGLIGFLDKYRGVLPADVKLYRRRRQFLPSRGAIWHSGRVQRFRLSRPSRARGTQCRRRVVRESDSHRRPRFHHRTD